MALLTSYYLPGLAVEDHAIDVPLDWRGTSPARLAGVQGAPSSPLAEASAAEKCDPYREGYAECHGYLSGTQRGGDGGVWGGFGGI